MFLGRNLSYMDNVDLTQPAFVFWMRRSKLRYGRVTRFDRLEVPSLVLCSTRSHDPSKSLGSKRRANISIWIRSGILHGTLL
jgi:hypothetical protein